MRLVAGCPKTFAACTAKFANGVNFRGFPHLPGNDFTFGPADPDGPRLPVRVAIDVDAGPRAGAGRR